MASTEAVNMSVQVLERKITDTNNDFDFSSLSIVPQVAGAKIERNNQFCSQKDLIKYQKNSFWQWLSELF